MERDHVLEIGITAERSEEEAVPGTGGVPQSVEVNVSVLSLLVNTLGWYQLVVLENHFD